MLGSGGSYQSLFSIRLARVEITYVVLIGG